MWKRGLKFVAGLDEAGRGPLAGPVVASAVCIDCNCKFLLKGINDSKKLSEKQRDFFYEKLTNDKNIKWGVGIVSEKVIDKINILQATKLAMQKAVDDLLCDTDVEYLILDGNFTLRQAQGKKYIPQKSVIKGDQKVMSVAVASIIAKVTRDKIMQKYHKQFPQYGFDKHKGYGTELHRQKLKELGPCKIHRKTFSFS